MRFRANYTVVYVGAQLGPEDRSLGLDWAEPVGDETDVYEFEVPTDDTHEPFVGLQAFDVESYGHEILVNGETLSGFDIPPNEGWQYWVDSLTGAPLHEGTNTIQISRDPDTDESFAIGTVRIHWKESVSDDEERDTTEAATTEAASDDATDTTSDDATDTASDDATDTESDDATDTASDDATDTTSDEVVAADTTMFEESGDE